MMISNTDKQHAAELFLAGQFENAAQAFTVLLRQGEDAELWNDWATAQLKCGYDVRAEWGHRRSLRFSASNRDAAVNLAVLLIAQGRLDEAAPILEPHAPTLSANEREALAFLTLRKQNAPGSGFQPTPQQERAMAHA